MVYKALQDHPRLPASPATVTLCSYPPQPNYIFLIPFLLFSLIHPNPFTPDLSIKGFPTEKCILILETRLSTFSVLQGAPSASLFSVTLGLFSMSVSLDCRMMDTWLSYSQIQPNTWRYNHLILLPVENITFPWCSLFPFHLSLSQMF